MIDIFSTKKLKNEEKTILSLTTLWFKTAKYNGKVVTLQTSSNCMWQLRLFMCRHWKYSDDFTKRYHD